MAQRLSDRLTLRRRATSAVALVSLLALLAVAVSGVIQMRKLISAEERQTVQAVAQGLGNASELALAVRDGRELSRLAERFMRDDQILLIAVYDSDGKLITQRTRTPDLWEHYQSGVSDNRLITHTQEVTLGATVNEFTLAADGIPAVATNRATRATVGRVVVGVSRAPAIAALRQQMTSTAVFTLLAAGVGAGLVFLLVGMWTRRLNQLVIASERMSEGNLDQSIAVDRHDEIGRLALSFENMRQAVRQRDAELRQFNSTLQEQVQDRTRALQEAFETTEVILRHVPVGIMLVGPDKRIRRVNEAALAMSGAGSAGEMVGSKCHQRVCPAQEGKCPVWDCGQSVDNAERILLRADGSRMPVLKTVVPIVLNGEKLLLEAFVDITSQKKAEATLKAAKEAAETADRAKSRFLATMSHEIRTPLNGIVGSVDLLRQTNLDENQRRYTQIARSSAEALLMVINDILDFSKIEAGRMELDAAAFQLHETVEDVTRIAALVAARKNLELSYFVEPGVPEQVVGDAGRLRQILTNLLNNAIKFTEQGHVVVRASVVEQTKEHALVRFMVSDTGIGIPSDRVDRLFQSFSQVDSSTTRKYGGSGLGLAISKRLAELMGGTIGVNSTPGKGSTFWFTACLAQVRDAREKMPPTLRDLRRLHVLAVDDNAVNCEILQQQLSLWNLEATTASNGPQALQMMQDAAGRGTPFDVAILDWHMPGMDGLQLAKAIRECAILQGVALIMLTSVEHQVCSTELRELGFSGYLIKPVGQSQLFDMISNAVRKPGVPSGQQSLSAGSTHASETSNIPSGIHVLLAEDNEINQMVATAILSKVGFTCDIVDNGIRAVDAAATGSYDVVLMDCQMPEMDGFAAAREIRKREAAHHAPPDARLPIVALTANAIKGDREMCLDAGMDDYVSKPIDQNKLCAAIRSAMSRSRWRRKNEPRATPSSSAVASGAPASPDTLAKTPQGISSAVAQFLRSPGTVDGLRASEAPASADAPPLNVAELCSRCMNNIEFTQRILRKFQDRVAEDITSLTRTVTERKLDEAGRLAHSLKGAAANLSAPAVRSVAAEIEVYIRAGDVAQAEKALGRLHAEVDRCLAFIPQAIASLTPTAPEKSRT